MLISEDNHLCIIGQFYDTDDSRLVTYPGLVYLYDYNREVVRQLEDDPVYGTVIEKLLSNHYRLTDYFDKRKSVNMRRFKYCPDCGKKIDWRELKKKAAEVEKT